MPPEGALDAFRVLLPSLIGFRQLAVGFSILRIGLWFLGSASSCKGSDKRPLAKALPGAEGGELRLIGSAELMPPRSIRPLRP
jgi:hypothetical protein